MKESPILFSAPMVRAILDGSKTQRRRVLKDQSIGEKYSHTLPDGRVHLEWEGSPCCGTGVWNVPEYSGEASSPFGLIGDRLWVRKTTYDVERYGFVGPVFAESDEGAHATAWGWGESDDPDHIEPYELRKRPAVPFTRSAVWRNDSMAIRATSTRKHCLATAPSACQTSMPTLAELHR